MGQTQGRERDGGEHERHGHHPEARDARETARHDHRPDGVADGDEADLANGTEIVGRNIEPDQRCHSDEADDKAQQTARIETVIGSGEPPENHTDKRRGRYEQPGERAGEAQLGVRYKEPRQRDLDGRVSNDPSPVWEQ